MSTRHSQRIPAIEQELSANDWLKGIDEALKSAAAGGRTLTPEQLLAKLRELAPKTDVPSTSIVPERIIRGYKVRRSYAGITHEERKARQAITVQAIAQALAQLRSH
jgi:predicted transcriptional regulator